MSPCLRYRERLPICKQRMHQPAIELDIVYHLADYDETLFVEEDPRIAQAARWIAEQFKHRKFYASIAIVDDATMRQLNAERLGHDWPTDVISFVLDELDGSVEGEVIASAQTASQVCSSAGWSAMDELLLYIVHGLLHVAGMDDIESEDRQAMRLMERECLMAVGLAQAEQHVLRFDSINHSEINE
ncbi:MAG: rRNA maturation RNase YbeY [Planctomycetales bacterium]|nr:rRNA maturation RNase YbeY [Planctomycetales bacterium]